MVLLTHRPNFRLLNRALRLADKALWKSIDGSGTSNPATHEQFKNEASPSCKLAPRTRTHVHAHTRTHTQFIVASSITNQRTRGRYYSEREREKSSAADAEHAWLAAHTHQHTHTIIHITDSQSRPIGRTTHTASATIRPPARTPVAITWPGDKPNHNLMPINSPG